MRSLYSVIIFNNIILSPVMLHSFDIKFEKQIYYSKNDFKINCKFFSAPCYQFVGYQFGIDLYLYLCLGW